MKNDTTFEGLKLYFTNSGYPSVTIGRKRFLVHRLVVERWYGPLEDMEVHHIDGDKMNWDAANLAVVSAPEHAIIHAKLNIANAGGDPETDSFCSTCDTVKPKSMFRHDRARWNGFTSVCNECHRIRMAQWRKDNPAGAKKVMQKAYIKAVANPERRAELLANGRRWYAANKAKVLAKQKAKRDEKLKKIASEATSC
jgi:hypothetical protein